MAAAQIAKKLKDKRQKNYIEGIFKKVIKFLAERAKRLKESKCLSVTIMF